MRAPLIFLGTLVAVDAFGAGPLKADFDRGCAIAKEMAADPSLKKKDGADRRTVFFKNVADDSEVSEEGKRLWLAVSKMVDKQKYEILLDMAHDASLKKWTCPSVKTLFSSK